MRARALPPVAIVFLLAVQTGVGVNAAGEGPAPAPTDELAAVLRAVSAREQKVKSFQYTWTVGRSVPRDSKMAPRVPGQAFAPGGPPVDMQLEEVEKTLVDGSRWRHDKHGYAWYEDRGQFLPDQTHRAFVDGVGRELDYGQGLVTPEFRCSAEQLPVTYAYRLLDPAIGLKASGPGPEDLRLAGRALVGGHPCVVIERRDDRMRDVITNLWWLAEDMDYALVQWHSFVGEADLWVQGEDMAYEKDERAGWRLVSWTLIVRSDVGPVPERLTCAATEVRFNQAVPDDAFDIVFPPGTTVYDQITDREHTVGPEPEHSPHMQKAAKPPA